MIEYDIFSIVVRLITHATLKITRYLGILFRWMNQAYSRLSTTHSHITGCKLLVCVYWTRLVLVRPAATLYSVSPLKHHPTGKQ